MKNYGTWIKLAVAAPVFWVLASCGHAPKRVSYDATASPSEIIGVMETDIKQGYDTQVDVLSQDDFASARNDLADAKEQIRKGTSQEKVLRKLGQARAYLDRAIRKADNRRAKLEGVLTARQAALAAGAREYPRQREELARIDNQVRNAADESSISPQLFSKLQNEYMDLELASVQSAHLSDARARLEGAVQKKASKFTPRTLNRAELDLRNAENTIASHRHNPEAFKDAVERVNASSQLLVDVGQKVRSGKAVLPEDVALKLVFQERGIRKMSDKLETLQSRNEQATETLSAQDQELKRARETQALEVAMAQARKEFNRNEAEVYRDGSKLLIRLKAMKFPVGKADLPPASLPLLAKVRTVAEDLNPMQVVIEGHTDSTGGERVNGPLSQKRAEAVAIYLQEGGLDSDKIQAVGYGFKKPIASNKSKEGRAQNRRVDVIITPAAIETSTTSM